MSEVEIRPEGPGEQGAVLDVVRHAFGAEDAAEAGCQADRATGTGAEAREGGAP